MNSAAREIFRFALCALALFSMLRPARAFCSGALSDEPLVELKTVEPTILIELRYATNRNITGHAIYPAGTPCLVRKSVAERLRAAQAVLRQRGFGLKIWDAWRPAAAQRALFEFAKNNAHFVADPDKRALHTWGVAVDATLVNAQGKVVPMPTDFDDFSSAAEMHYAGENSAVAKNLRLLQGAMGSAGFYGTRREWWHFIARNWSDYGPAAAPGARNDENQKATDEKMPKPE
jgi:D-alanyl-D-alanine dipeptidase